ncbi:hypothetical protein P9112_002430 [Eukaryota sp. TZLM1-RC]
MNHDLYQDFPIESLQPVSRSETVHVIRGRPGSMMVGKGSSGSVLLGSANLLAINPHFSIAIRNLPWHFNDRSLFNLFAQFPEFEPVMLRINDKGFAVVVFKDPQACHCLFNKQEDPNCTAILSQLEEKGATIESIEEDQERLTQFLSSFINDL